MGEKTINSGRYVIELVDVLLPIYMQKLGLEDWNIKTKFGEIHSDEVLVAEVRWDNTPRHATMIFNSAEGLIWVDGVADYGSYSVQHVLAHELIHVLFAEANTEQFIRVLKGSQVFSAEVSQQVHDILEWLVDEVAFKLVKAGTLPMELD